MLCRGFWARIEYNKAAKIRIKVFYKQLRKNECNLRGFLASFCENLG